MPRIGNIFLSQGVPGSYGRNRTNIADNNMFGRTTPEPLNQPTKKLFQAIDDENLVSVKKVYHEKIRKDVAKTGSLT
ncbi:hypothetical protein GO685_04625 [Wolbachia endosymbiont of Madathamugadia hiepei]|uniref:hypothetical protein n=1 Tax=Wolbachia endosymbiont of Madathamugadia hiepei TaxID=1241303 RepID=UPI00158A9D37|nr:hypothetical protein [Wolbachia endosymbiont of Madathamugadia hiepei]NUX01747.1 hypothetical protein [Wolbachia endosymbiont of Madathamugadia hiepei]